jgi:ADP-ribosylglycohydrolase
MAIDRNSAEMAVKIVKAAQGPEQSRHTLLICAVCGSLSGVKIGDSIGKRVETMSPEAIIEATSGKGIRGFGKALQDDKFEFFKGLEPGDHTDDYQLTSSTAASLIVCNRFDMENMGFMLAVDCMRKAAGWGKTTRIAAEEILNYFQCQKKRPRSPFSPAPPAPVGQGCGNGVAMRISPVALYYALKKQAEPKLWGYFNTQLTIDSIKLGRMTHPDIRASIAGYAVAKIIYELVDQGYKKKWSEDDRYEFLSKVIHSTKIAEWLNKEHGAMVDPFSAKLELIRDRKLLGDFDGLLNAIGTKCYAMESVPFAIGVFLRHPANFTKGILEAVNAGGDTDTTAAMVGSMIGANVGIMGIPNRFKFYRADFWEPINLGIGLYKTVFLKK